MPVTPNWKKEQIIALHNERMTVRKISETTHVAKSTCQDIINLYKSKQNCFPRLRKGKKRKLSIAQERFLVILSKKFPFKTARELQEEANLCNVVSVDTIKRTLRRNALFGRISARRPLLSRLQKSKRRKWCVSKLGWSQMKWNQIIFTDECML